MIEPRSARPDDVPTEFLLAPAGRPLFVFAHQDDETVLAGIVRRLVGDDERGRFVWWTNGDGPAPAEGADPAEYAKRRIAESSGALRILGASPSRKVDLETSEIDNYRQLVRIARGGRESRDAIDYFKQEARRVEEAVRDADPDRVFVLAFQGGHPEHDLVHVMVARALARLRAETGRAIPLVQCPAYEYGILWPMRFKPWFRGDRRRTRLSRIELDAKTRLFDAYPSQRELIESFRRVLGVAGLANVLRGRPPLTPERWLSVEHFGVVDPDLDHGRSTHRLEAMNYPFDDFEGTPIRFSTMVGPVARAIAAA